MFSVKTHSEVAAESSAPVAFDKMDQRAFKNWIHKRLRDFLDNGETGGFYWFLRFLLSQLSFENRNGWLKIDLPFVKKFTLVILSTIINSRTEVGVSARRSDRFNSHGRPFSESPRTKLRKRTESFHTYYEDETARWQEPLCAHEWYTISWAVTWTKRNYSKCHQQFPYRIIPNRGAFSSAQREK